jgi:hypothetical protein
MGMYDTVTVPCPQCGARAEFQSKSGNGTLEMFSLDDAPDDVLLDIIRHPPTTCAKCGVLFGVEVVGRRPQRTLLARSVIWKAVVDDRHEASGKIVQAMSAVTQRPHLRRVEFRLSMPNRASWNGEWSGEGRNYSVVHELSDAQLVKLFDQASEGFDLSKCRRIWTRRWSDGWVAQVSARVVSADEELPRSDGFSGYDWLIDNILATGNPHG